MLSDWLKGGDDVVRLAKGGDDVVRLAEGW